MIMYRLTHGFGRYTGNIPEVLINTARGRSPRAVLISTEGIFLQPYMFFFCFLFSYMFFLQPWVNLFVARATPISCFAS